MTFYILSGAVVSRQASGTEGIRLSEGPRYAGQSLLFCVTGSVAATNAVWILQILIERGIFDEVHVALSNSARRFVREEPLAILAGRPCITDLFDEAARGRPAHVEVANRCQIAVIVPATANVMAKLAHGIADDTVTNMLSVFEGKRILVPAAHPVTSRQLSYRKNLELLREAGFMFCGPVEGYSMSEGRRGSDVLAMPGPETVAAFIEHVRMTGEAPVIPRQ